MSWWLRNRRLFFRKKKNTGSELLGQECDSSNREVEWGLYFGSPDGCMSSFLGPGCWTLLWVTREETSLWGILWHSRALVMSQSRGWGCASAPLGALDSLEGAFTIFAGLWRPVGLLSPSVVQQAFGAWTSPEDGIWTTRTFSFGKYVYEATRTSVVPES